MTPFYWHDLDGRPGWDQWLYRIAVSVGLGCLVGLVGGLLLVILAGLWQAIGV